MCADTRSPLTKVNGVRFGAGFLVFGVMWMAGLGIVAAVLVRAAERMPRPDIHSTPNTRKPAPKRAAFILDSGLPVYGDSDGSFSAAAMLAL